jgi:5-methylcytosine-specific restriction endonuclease McrA
MQKALLLDRNYMAISVITWKRAITLMMNGKVEAVSETYSAIIPTSGKLVNIPSILRLIASIPWKAHQSRMKFSRKHVMLRDNRECQYCKSNLGKNSGTIDHVIPSSRGGKSEYTNCVASCKNCNNQKANRTPAEAKMTLLKKPRKPTFLSLYRHYINNPPPEWNDYIIGMQ